MVIRIQLFRHKLVLVDYIVIVEGTFVGEVVCGYWETSRKVDGLPVDAGD